MDINKMTEIEKMTAGLMYNNGDEEIVRETIKSRKLIHEFNNCLDEDRQTVLLKQIFGSTGKNINIEPTLRVDYGFNIHVGENFYANFNCIITDTCPVHIGSDVMFAPNVQLYTATHPIDPVERNSGLEYGKPITIGDNCWLGGGVIILPGVTLGDNVVVGAGAVVTKSFESNVVIAGNPAKVIKRIDVQQQ